MQVAYTGRKLSPCFNIKDPSKFEHQHDVLYYVDCPNERCREKYIGENGRRISGRIKDHNGRDLKHIFETFRRIWTCERQLIAKNFTDNHWKREIAESLLIYEKQPMLNTHDKSVPLKLFD